MAAQCACGEQQSRRPCHLSVWHCEKTCGKLLACGRHLCDQVCCGCNFRAEAPCPPAWNEPSKMCMFHASAIVCLVSQVCQSGRCGPCPEEGERHCPCGKALFPEPKCDEKAPPLPLLAQLPVFLVLLSGVSQACTVCPAPPPRAQHCRCVTLVPALRRMNDTAPVASHSPPPRALAVNAFPAWRTQAADLWVTCQPPSPSPNTHYSMWTHIHPNIAGVSLWALWALSRGG